MYAINDCKNGVFIKELKNRFLCEVEVEGKRTVCYVPSSCHLNNFLDLHGKSVLLTPTKAKNSRTKYALYAVPYKRNYIVLNTSMANAAIKACINQRKFYFLGIRTAVKRETTIEGYKCDFYIEDTDTLIEVKSIIATTETAVFPSVYSERTINQLRLFQKMLSQGKTIHLFIISLHPYMKRIQIDKTTEFIRELKCCLELGLQLHGFTSRLQKNGLVIEREIPVTVNV